MPEFNMETTRTPERTLFSIETFASQLENSNLESHQEIAAIGYFLLRQRAESVGASGIKDFNPSSVATWDEYQEHFWSDFRRDGSLANAAAVYNSELNLIASEDGGRDASLSKFTHEMAHYVSSTKNLPEKSTNTTRYNKTGFDSIYTKDGSRDEESYRDAFKLFNEGVTEMITHDLCDSFTTESLGDLYKKILPGQAKRHLEEVKTAHEEWLKKIAPAEKEQQEKELAEFTEFIATVTDEKNKEMYIKAHQGRMGQWQRMRDRAEQQLAAMDILPLEKGDPLEDKGEVAYSEMVELVGKILDGMAHSAVNSASIPFEEARMQAWNDLQKAYFQGDVMYLRKLEAVYGEGFLRKLATLNYSTVTFDEAAQNGDWKEYDEIKGVIESVNAKLVA